MTDLTEVAAPADLGSAFEIHTIAPIPKDQRGGAPSSVFTLWSATNLMPLTLITGAVAIAYGLSFPWAMAAIVIGNLVGAISMALHAVQGPRLGVTQIIQSRGQFGFIGGVILFLVLMATALGFAAANLVLGGQILNEAITQIPVAAGAVIVGLGSFAIGAYGYHLLHKVNRYTTVLFVVALIVGSILIFTNATIPKNYFSIGGFSAGPFVAMIAIGAVWQISYAPYVSDYTRYLPEDTRASSVFWWNYTGSAIGAIFAMALGAAIALLNPAADLVGQFGRYDGAISGVILVILALGMVDTNIVNVYTGALCGAVIGQTAKSGWLPKGRTRVVIALAFTLVSMGLALISVETSSNLLTEYTNFLLFLVYVLVPWTAINLVDYYLVRKGDYSYDDLFTSRGLHGNVNWPAVALYLIGCGIEVPFVNTTFFEGPIAKAMNGADISWIVSGVTVSVAYYFLARHLGRGRQRAAVRAA